jgi:hypothetical protein
MATIFQVTKGNGRQDLLAPFTPGDQVSWRDDLVPASFRGACFHVESMSKQGGRRIVEHEFPKRELPYAEDLGRKAQEFTIRGYLIQFMFDSGGRVSAGGVDWRYMRDYRIARDALLNELDAGLAGQLQLPTLSPMWVRCARYSLNEEERYGGYCVIDMTFNEYGLSPNPDVPQTQQTVIDTAAAQVYQTVVSMAPKAPYTSVQLAPLAYGPYAPASPYTPRTLTPVKYGSPPTSSASVAQTLKPIAYYGIAPALAAPQFPTDPTLFPGNNPPYWQ